MWDDERQAKPSDLNDINFISIKYEQQPGKLTLATIVCSYMY